MTPEQTEGLQSAIRDLAHLTKNVLPDVPEPTRAILATGMFLVKQKIRYALGETDA